MKKIACSKKVKINNKSSISYRDDVISYAMGKYGTHPEYLWRSMPKYAVLRNKTNQKWYGLIMDVPAEKLGMQGDNVIDILNIKYDPGLSDYLLDQNGILPSYHMKKKGWISVLLDGSVEKKLLFSLLDMSYEIVAGKKLSGKSPRHQEWIVHVNPKLYDLPKAFAENEDIIWKQSSNINVGDIIYLYVASPISAVLYCCEAITVDIPYQYADENVHMSRVMRLKKIKQYSPSFLPFSRLKSYGINAVRGPRRIPYSMSCELERHRHEQ